MCNHVVFVFIQLVILANLCNATTQARCSDLKLLNVEDANIPPRMISGA